MMQSFPYQGFLWQFRLPLCKLLPVEGIMEGMRESTYVAYTIQTVVTCTHTCRVHDYLSTC